MVFGDDLLRKDDIVPETIKGSTALFPAEESDPFIDRHFAVKENLSVPETADAFAGTVAIHGMNGVCIRIII